jgi:hypothetical protein
MEINLEEIKEEGFKQYFVTDNKIRVEMIIFRKKTIIQKTIRSYFSPLIRNFEEEGEINIGLIIGPYFLHWDETSICIPRRISGDVLRNVYDMYYQPDFLDIEVDVSKTMTKLVKLICEWNIKYEYDKNKKNSYHFIETIMKELAIWEFLGDTSNDRPFYNFLREIKENGTIDGMKYFLNQSKNKN